MSEIQMDINDRWNEILALSTLRRAHLRAQREK